jgi:hypothetical protein
MQKLNEKNKRVMKLILLLNLQPIILQNNYFLPNCKNPHSLV